VRPLLTYIVSGIGFSELRLASPSALIGSAAARYALADTSNISGVKGLVRTVVIAALAYASSLVLACSRYERVPDYFSPQCQPTRRPDTTFAADPLLDTVGSPVLRGRVFLAASMAPIAHARVTLDVVPPRDTSTDSSGTFIFLDVPPGLLQVRTRAVGTGSRADTVTIGSLGTHTLIVRLPSATFDGLCSGFGLVRVRKPWWRVW